MTDGKRIFPCCQAVLVAGLLFVGCQRAPQPAPKTADTKSAAAKEDAKPVEPEPATASGILEKAARHLAEGEAAQAKKSIDALEARKQELAPAELIEFERLKIWANEKSPTVDPTVAGKAPAAKDPTVPVEPAPPPEPVQQIPELAEAKKLAAAENWDAATTLLAKILEKAEPGPAQREAVALQSHVEKQMASLRELREAVGQLGGAGPQVEAARLRLWRDSDRALPALLAGLTDGNPAQVRGILRMLSERNEPTVTLSAVSVVLDRPDASDAWPAALEELSRLRTPQAGERLLKLALEAKTPEQRSAALQALAVSVEPPAMTFRSLLPSLQQDGPELPFALDAAARGAFRHRQQDLLTGRVLRDGSLNADEKKQLAGLPARLMTLSDGLKSTPRSATAIPAAMLASALGVTPAPAIKGVRVVGCCGEEVNGPVASVIDGIWDVVDHNARTSWYDAGTASNPWIVFDLGESRIVAGVRIWNFNSAGLTDRGWRDVDVFVTDDLADVPPSASGVLPKAFGRKDYGDYSDTIPVPFARGRYVKLQARTLWSDQKVSGLSEVQILGW